MGKLSDTAVIILSTAAAREDRRVYPLRKLKAPVVAVQKTLERLLASGLIEEVPARRDDQVWQQAGAGERKTLLVTAAGLAAIGVTDVAVPSAAANPRTKREKRRPRGKAHGKGGEVAERHGEPREGAAKKQTKQALVIGLLQCIEGATIREIQEVTGWLPHSVRGFLTAALKRRLKLKVVSEKDEKSGERRYRIGGSKQLALY